MRKITFVAVLAIVFGSAFAQATELSNMYRGARPMGMGGAFTALADDENAVFYNPAGLASVKKSELDIINLTGEVSNNITNFAKDVGNIPQPDTTGQTAQTMQNYIGQPMHLRVSEFLNFTTTNFELGAYGLATVDASVNSPSYPTASVDAKVDAGAVLGLAHTFMEDKLQAGIGLKYLQRRRFVRLFTAADIVSATNNMNNSLQVSGSDLQTKSAVGIDLGAIYKLNSVNYSSQVGLSILNLGDVNFGDYSYTTTSGLTNTVPNKIPMTVNLGYAATRQFEYFSGTFAADYMDLLNNSSTANSINGSPSDSDYGKRIHLGAEIKFPYILSLRAGFNEGYPSYGLGLNFWLIELKYASYKEEVGGYAGQVADQRQVVQLLFGF